MKHLQGKFSGYGNLDIHYQCWLPAGKPKALLVVVHGLAEHSGRYAGLARYFTARDYAVYSFDHRGHGKSEGQQGHVERFRHYLNDLNTFLKTVPDNNHNARVFLIGHSMGGMIAAIYAIHHQQEFAGLVLSGATISLASNPSLMITAAANLLSLLSPKTGVTLIDASAISRDTTVVDSYVNDPLVYRGKISARLGTELMKMIRKLPQQMPEINLPALIMHGTADRLSDPKGSEMLHQRISSRDKTLTLYDGFYHEIFNEPGHEQVFADIENWLAARL
ncbi:MAG: lysophospholipase [Dehalococcoidales bacterium]|nr:lysophospholipase [Dehalococcoidales bacterium]